MGTGSRVGLEVGTFVGPVVGAAVPFKEGAPVGPVVGLTVPFMEGAKDSVGEAVGSRGLYPGTGGPSYSTLSTVMR